MLHYKGKGPLSSNNVAHPSGTVVSKINGAQNCIYSMTERKYNKKQINSGCVKVIV